MKKIPNVRPPSINMTAFAGAVLMLMNENEHDLLFWKLGLVTTPHMKALYGETAKELNVRWNEFKVKILSNCGTDLDRWLDGDYVTPVPQSRKGIKF